ncbi:MAG: heme-binding protein [Gammaproteobacteria bacterium]|nr:heme-binding protein [Gammaproteobacteria bacterium]
MNISLADAKHLADAARARAEAINKPVTIAVVDTGGFLVALERMDGARPLQPSIATAKAYSAAIMQRPSLMLKGWADSQPGFFAQVARMGHHPIVATDGGVPIKRAGAIIGGLGVAGGTGPEDQQICEEVLRGLGYELDFEQFNRIRK